MTDEELIRQAQHGDADAFDHLVLRHQSAVYRAALAAVRVPEDAEEVAQDAFVRAWRSIGRFRGESSFRTWMLKIAWRRALSRRRSVAYWWQTRAHVEPDVDARATERSDDEMGARELRGHIAQAVRALSPKLRDALLLAQSGDYGYEDIAVMLATTNGTVKWRVSEARRRVRLHLRKVGYGDA